MRQLAKTCHKSATSDVQYNAMEAIILGMIYEIQKIPMAKLLLEILKAAIRRFIRRLRMSKASRRCEKLRSPGFGLVL